MPSRKRKEVDIYYYSHPKNGSIRYIGSEKEARIPLWLLNDREYQGWMPPQLNPEINILDTVHIDEQSFWTEFYSDLFISWGFNLIHLDSSRDMFRRKVTDILLINLSVLKSTLVENNSMSESKIEGLDCLIIELHKLSVNSNSKIVSELFLMIHCLFEIGIPFDICIKMRFKEVLKKGYISMSRIILPFSDVLMQELKSSQSKSPEEANQFVFVSLLKMTRKSERKLYVLQIINAVSTYIGCAFQTNGKFDLEFGQYQYRKCGNYSARTVFLARYFNCNTRLELLMKLDLIPKLR